jgi:hypothetical protein
MPGAAGGGTGGAATMGMKIDGDFTMQFDRKRGALGGVTGTLTTSMSAAGMMQLETKSTLTLKAL